jgi:hypothetical protein
MATTIEMLRDELYKYFDEELAPLIRTKDTTDELAKTMVVKMNAKFGVKYKYFAKRYENTIRISANYVPLGIIFFMAATQEGKKDQKFIDPCYWGKK